MWKDIVIGDSTGDQICSATIVYNFDFSPHDISHNQVSYWITLRNPEIGMKIYKNTKEGQHIYKLLVEDKCSAETLYLYLFSIAMKKITPTKMSSMIEDMVADAEERGYNRAKQEIRDWLHV